MVGHKIASSLFVSLAVFNDLNVKPFRRRVSLRLRFPDASFRHSKKFSLGVHGSDRS